MFMPIPGKDITDNKEAYNFYLSQIRITIEWAFEILVHLLVCLCGPLLLSRKKVPALAPLIENDMAVWFSAWKCRVHQQAISSNSNCVPEDLLVSGHHCDDQVRLGRHLAKEALDATTPI
ncbi:hypothetical protein ACHAW6_010944 [Cyclotella cf. meneghiniana]